MAKAKDKTPTSAEAAARAEVTRRFQEVYRAALDDNPAAKQRKSEGRYAIAHPTVRDGSVAGGLLIEGGFAFTDDIVRAHASMENGCAVIDTISGKAPRICGGDGD